jgi:hypothetical protein
MEVPMYEVPMKLQIFPGISLLAFLALRIGVPQGDF